MALPSWRNRNYCAYFNDRKHDGQDLATVVYTRRVTRRDVDAGTKHFLRFELRGTHKNMHPAWAIVAAIRNAAGVRATAGVSCDASDQAVFASVPGAEDGDLLLLDFAFDDATTLEAFQNPPGTRTVGFTVGEDETGILYAQEGLSSGPTGQRTTRGRGASDCKDVNLTILVRKK